MLSTYRDKYLSEQGGIARSGDTYANVPESSKSYWFNIDNMDYNRKETVVRPILEVNVKNCRLGPFQRRRQYELCIHS